MHPLNRAEEREIRAICEAADLDHMHVVLQTDFGNRPEVYREVLRPGAGRRGSTKAPRLRFWRQLLHDLEGSDVRFEEHPKHLDAASRKVVTDFFRFGRRQCPADRYAVFFYGHSFGPMGLFYDSRKPSGTPKTLRLTKLASALRSASGPVDLVMFRDCFVDTLEMVYQLRGAARFMIASQSGVPIAGAWPWPSMQSTLMPSASSSDVSRAIATQLGSFFDVKANRGGDEAVPVSLTNIEAAGAVTVPLRNLADALETARRNPARNAACARAIDLARVGHNPAKLGDPALVDITTMCQNLQELGRDPVARAAKRLGHVVNTQVIMEYHSRSARFRGLNIYCKPVTKADFNRSFIEASDEEDIRSDARYYKTLALSQETGWDRIAQNPLKP
ncbi:MAG: clostripain-related cysteine peptidase [Vicinamibacterales bacterium]